MSGYGEGGDDDVINFANVANVACTTTAPIKEYRFKEMILSRRHDPANKTTNASGTNDNKNPVVNVNLSRSGGGRRNTFSINLSSSSSLSNFDSKDSTLIQLPTSILYKILSYLHLEDYRDIARLRTISKGMQGILSQYIREAMPYCLSSFYGGGVLDRLIKGDPDFDDSIGTFHLRHGDQQQEAQENKSYLFQGCQHQMLTVVMEIGQWTWHYDEEKTRSMTTHPPATSSSTTIATGAAAQDEHAATVYEEEEYARLCRKILSSESFERRKLSKEAAVKGMFLPMLPAKINNSKRNKKRRIGFLAILTLKILPDELANPTSHRQGEADGVYYLRMCDLDTVLLHYNDNNTPKLPFLPREEDLSHEFRAYTLDVDSINHGQEANMILDDGSVLVGVPMFICDSHCNADTKYTSVHSDYQNKNMLPEGVAIADGMVPELLHDKLIRQIDRLAQLQKVDYHPNSNNIVRDLVHPALYAYVKGVSEVIPKDAVPPCQPLDDVDDDRNSNRNQYRSNNDDEIKDYWGRKYEESAKYQWLPTYFDVAPDGSCHICDYINNLVPRQDFTDLYSSLEELFSQALPLLESTYSYGRLIRKSFLEYGYSDYYEGYWSGLVLDCITKVPRWSLRGQRLQVITKIVDYELDSEQKYEGVWHVEGMSHEEIVATAIYILERDDDIVGGDILFKRALIQSEASRVHNLRDAPPGYARKFFSGSPIPLGKVETLSKRLIAFPNSHIHKVTTLEHKSSPTDSNKGEGDDETDGERATKKRRGMKQKRRIVVFFLINPEKRIISTREVPPQQSEAGGSMTYEQACEHRLELMKERKYTKQDWNVREISLCEH